MLSWSILLNLIYSVNWHGKSMIWSLNWKNHWFDHCFGCNIPSSLILDMEWREFFVWKHCEGALMIRMRHINEEGLLLVLKLLVEQRGTPDLLHLKANAFHDIKNTSQRKIKMDNMLRLWFHLVIKLRGHSRFQHWLQRRFLEHSCQTWSEGYLIKR